MDERQAAAIKRLVESIRALHLRAGEPSAREIARRIGKGGLSHSSVNAVLRSGALPRWGPLELVVVALGGQVDEFREQWTVARELALDSFSDELAATAEGVVIQPLIGEAAANYLASADEQYRRGDYDAADRALTLMMLAVRRDRTRLWKFSGRLQEALSALDDVLVTQLTLLSETDVDVLETKVDRASILFEQGLRNEGISQATEALRDQASTLGPDHANTLDTQQLLGFMLSRSGRDFPVDLDLQEALRISLDKYGEHHHVTLSLRNSLMVTLMREGHLQEALIESEIVLSAYRRILHNAHPQVLARRNNHARVCILLNRLDDAEAELIDLVKSCLQVLGERSIITLLARNNLALVYDKKGRFEEAEEEYQEVMQIRRSAFGEDHPETLRTRNNLAFLLDERGDLEAAVSEYRAVLAGRTRVLGEDDENTQRTRGDLAYALDRLGRFDEAEPEYRTLLEQYRRLLGVYHPRTLTAWKDLIYALSQLGRSDDVAKEYAMMFQAQRQAEATEHPDESYLGPHGGGRTRRQEPPLN
jgi:tetratricopeptide (TPR) repeat protein